MIPASRKLKPNPTPPNLGRRQILTGFEFVFSADLDRWIRSGKVKCVQYKKAKASF